MISVLLGQLAEEETRMTVSFFAGFYHEDKDVGYYY